jgi:hypothetical protein
VPEREPVVVPTLNALTVSAAPLLLPASTSDE